MATKQMAIRTSRAGQEPDPMYAIFTTEKKVEERLSEQAHLLCGLGFHVVVADREPIGTFRVVWTRGNENAPLGVVYLWAE